MAATELKQQHRFSVKYWEQFELLTWGTELLVSVSQILIHFPFIVVQSLIKRKHLENEKTE